MKLLLTTTHRFLGQAWAVAHILMCLALWSALLPQVGAQLKGDKILVLDPKTHPTLSIQDRESPAQRDARLQWFREARFGLFIHWGLYAIPAGRWNGAEVGGEPKNGEWIMNTASISVASYKALAPRFNPTAFNAHAIVALAKSAGMRYIVITAKHHDGFAMYGSKVDSFNIVQATPFGRDPLKELAEECRKQGLKLGFYYSQNQDWTTPGGAASENSNHKPPTYHWDQAQNGDFDGYLHSKVIPQIKELLSNYGEFPSILWFDTPDENMTPLRSAEIVQVLNQYPNLIWNNRLGGGYGGDTETPEQFVPPQGFPGKDWEACMTINDTWGFKRDDTNFKSTKTLLTELIRSSSEGGNFLLNIGPDDRGIVPPAEIERLKEIGSWMVVNGEAIYGTSATIIGAESGTDTTTDGSAQIGESVASWRWRSTTSSNRIYVHLLQRPDGASPILHLQHVPRHVSIAYLLADTQKRSLNLVQSGEGIDIMIPSSSKDQFATVVVLQTNQ